MQLVPEHREEYRDNEPRYGCKNDKRGGSGQAEWPDHKNRLNKVHPEPKIDQRLCPAKSNQKGPAEMVATEQRAKGDTGLERIISKSGDLVQRAARNNAIVDRPENQRDQPSDHDAPDQAVDPHAR